MRRPLFYKCNEGQSFLGLPFFVVTFVSETFYIFVGVTNETERYENGTTRQNIQRPTLTLFTKYRSRTSTGAAIATPIKVPITI